MMQRLRNFTVYVIIVIMLITMTPIHIVSASLTEGDFEYDDNGDGTATVIDYTGVSTDIVIPDTVGGLKVTSIRDLAFSEKQLTSVIIPDSVTEIGAYAFFENQLTEVIIPDSVIEIGYGAFQDNQLTNVTISKNITIIKDSTFYLNNLSSVIIPESITEIGFGAFADNQITHIRIPHNVTDIRGGAFAENQITRVSIPKSVTFIGVGAFYNNQLETVIIHNPSIIIEPSVILPDNTMIPEVFDGNQSNPTDLTFIGYLGSTAEAYATSHGHTFTDIATVPPIVEAVDVQILNAHVVNAKVPFQVQVTVDEGFPVTGSVHHYVRVQSDKEGTVVNDVYTPFNRNISDYETRAILEVALTHLGIHEVTVTVDGVRGNVVTVEVAIDQNTLITLKNNIDAAKGILQNATAGTDLGQYNQEAIHAFQAAIEEAESVYISETSTEDEIIAASVKLAKDILDFEYYIVSVYEVEPLHLNLLAVEGATYTLPNEVMGRVLIPVPWNGRPLTHNEFRYVPVTWFANGSQNQVTEVDISKPGMYQFSGQVPYLSTDGIETEAELTLVVLEGKSPQSTVIDGKITAVFDNGTMVQGLSADVTIKAAEISHNIPNEWRELEVIPVGKIMKFALEGAQGPIQMDILIPLDPNTDSTKAIIAYFNESIRRWEYVQGSEVVEIDGKLYAKATVTHNSIYGVVEVNAKVVANGMQITNPGRNATELILPAVPQGYAVEIDYSNDEGLISLDGKITPPKETTIVEIALKVYNTQDPSDYEYTDEFEVIVPAKGLPPSDGGYGGVVTYPTTNTSEISIDGARISLNSVTLTFPAQALNGTFKVSVEKVSDPSRLPLTDNLRLVSDVYEITKDKAGHFNEPITITIPFYNSVIDLEKYDIAIYWLDEATGEWVKLDHVKVDVNKGLVSGDVDHFTKFAVIATEKAVATEQTKKVQLPDITGHWAEANIRELVNLGVITGYPNGTFLPDHHITRAEFVTMLVRAFGLVAKEGKIFADTTHHWAKEAIGIATALGIVAGYNETTFGADDYITREQMAVLIARAMILQANRVPLEFIDSTDISPWAVNAITATFQAGIITGYPDQSFKPQGNASRAEAVTVLKRALDQQ